MKEVWLMIECTERDLTGKILKVYENYDDCHVECERMRKFRNGCIDYPPDYYIYEAVSFSVIPDSGLRLDWGNVDEECELV